MTQSVIFQNIQTLIAANLLTEADLAEAVNQKLAPFGVTLSSDLKVSKRKVASKPKTKPAKAERTRTEYSDGRTNNHALMLAVLNCGEEGGQAEAIRAQLIELGHEMPTAIFNTTKTNLKNKYKFLKSKGSKREQVLSLTAAGKKEIERLESAPADEEEVAE